MTNYIVISNRGHVCSEPYLTRSEADKDSDDMNVESRDGSFYWVIEEDDTRLTLCGLGYEAAAGCY